MLRFATPDFSIPTDRDIVVYAFDLDHTLIFPSDPKAKFVNGVNDWKLFEGAKRTLQGLDSGVIVIFTNQSGISNKKVALTEKIFEQRITLVMQALGVPIVCYASTGSTGYRKPCTNMWNAFEAEVTAVGSFIDYDPSVYVGDAGGRVARTRKPKMKKDFSASDRLFAMNVGVNFEYPEMFFRNESEERAYALKEDLCVKFFPTSLEDAQEIVDIHNADHYPGHQELIVNVGYPASGKSYFSNRVFKSYGYDVFSNDDFGGKTAKARAAVRASLKKGKSVVADNTHMTVEHRKEFIFIAEELGIPVRIFWFTADFELCMSHSNYYRGQMSKGNVMPNVAYYTARKKFEPPSKESDLYEVVEIPFLPPYAHKEWYYQYV